MSDDPKQPSTRAALVDNAKRRAKGPALTIGDLKLPKHTIADYSAMSPLAIGGNSMKRARKPTL